MIKYIFLQKLFQKDLNKIYKIYNILKLLNYNLFLNFYKIL